MRLDDVGTCTGELTLPRGAAPGDGWRLELAETSAPPSAPPLTTAYLGPPVPAAPGDLRDPAGHVEPVGGSQIRFTGFVLDPAGLPVAGSPVSWRLGVPRSTAMPPRLARLSDRRGLLHLAAGDSVSDRSGRFEGTFRLHEVVSEPRGLQLWVTARTRTGEAVTTHANIEVPPAMLRIEISGSKVLREGEEARFLVRRTCSGNRAAPPRREPRAPAAPGRAPRGASGGVPPARGGAFRDAELGEPPPREL